MNVNNNCTMIGRLIKDPVLRVTQNGNSQVTFTIAVQRTFKGTDGRYESDFIQCMGWGKMADTIDKFFRKGSRIVVNGEWRTGNYKDRNGNTVYTNQLQIGDFGFIDKKGERPEDEAPGAEAEPQNASSVATTAASAAAPQSAIPDFMSVPADMEAELPFV